MKMRIAYFHEAKEALSIFIDSHDKNNEIEKYGIPKEKLSEYINNFNSPLYNCDFLEKTVLPYDYLKKDEKGYYITIKI
jgi:hypothetical protein